MLLAFQKDTGKPEETSQGPEGEFLDNQQQPPTSPLRRRSSNLSPPVSIMTQSTNEKVFDTIQAMSSI